MLSPESFYYFFREHYGYPSRDNIIFCPKYNGAKEIINFMPYLHGDFKDQYLTKMDIDEKIKFGSILLHDQEPLMDLNYLTNIYQQKYFPNKSPESPEETIRILRTWFRSVKNPIWCHSEKNSKEIFLLENNGFVSCYYWYHGIISLNWFNEWRWCHKLDQIIKNPGSKKFLLYARDFTGTREYRKIFLENIKSFRDYVLYDWEQQKTITADYSAKIDVNDAVNSYIHIIAETIFDTDKQHLTEKSLKPIVMSQPFIILSGPKSLEYLRSYGFQTFDSIWDESYDREPDSKRRMEMVIDLITYLCNLSESDFFKIYEKTIPILEHNRKWFYSEKFYKILINELESNLESAFSRRDDIYKISPTQWKELIKQCTTDMPIDVQALAKIYQPQLLIND